jgi:hypothetical protein
LPKLGVALDRYRWKNGSRVRWQALLGMLDLNDVIRRLAGVNVEVATGIASV